MNFLELIENKYPVKNKEYLNEYIKHCKHSFKNSSVYTENHHILPKHLFPEYRDFNTYSENKATLSYRNHAIAHYLLALALDLDSLWNICFLMFNSKSKEIPKEDRILYYETVKTNYAKINRKSKAFDHFEDLEDLWNEAGCPKAYKFANWLKSYSFYDFNGSELRHLVSKFKNTNPDKLTDKVNHGYSKIWDKGLVYSIMMENKEKITPRKLLKLLNAKGITCTRRTLQRFLSVNPDIKNKLDCSVGQPSHECWDLLPEIKEVWKARGFCGCENLSKFLSVELDIKVSKTTCLKIIKLFREED